MHEDGDFSSCYSAESYNRQLAKCLMDYEIAASSEQFYILHTTYLTGAFQIGCGLSPVRTFRPCIILSQPYKECKISFDITEWKSLIDILQKKIDDFFNTPTATADLVTFPCSDFVRVAQMVFEDGIMKVLQVTKCGVTFYLCEEDVLKIIHADLNLLRYQLSILDSLDFGSFYHNVINSMNSWNTSNEPGSKLELIQLLYDAYKADGNVLLLKALSEYMYFYRDNVLIDLNK